MLLVVAAALVVWGQETKVERTAVSLGETTVTIVKLVTDRWADWSATDCPVPIRMLNLHANEVTSVHAAKLLLGQEPCGGTIVFLEHSQPPQRNVEFKLAGTTYSFDPNRIFTRRGREISLGATGAPEQAVAAFVDKLLEVYEWNTTPTIITLHNTGGAYGANSYLAGAQYAAEAARVAIQGGSSTFLFLTRAATYDCVVASKALVSLVLQSPDIVKNVVDANEGSLSLFAETQNKDYVNSETYLGVLRDQFLVLKTVVDVCVLKRETLAPQELRIDAGKKYCRETTAGRTGVCQASGAACVGSVKTAQVGCDAGQVCCVTSGCTRVNVDPPAAGKCIADADCPGGSGFSSNGGAQAIGCQTDAAAIKCCTTFAVPPLPLVAKPARTPAPTSASGEPAPAQASTSTSTLRIVVDSATTQTAAAAATTSATLAAATATVGALQILQIGCW